MKSLKIFSVLMLITASFVAQAACKDRSAAGMFSSTAASKEKSAPVTRTSPSTQPAMDGKKSN